MAEEKKMFWEVVVEEIAKWTAKNFWTMYVYEVLPRPDDPNLEKYLRDMLKPIIKKIVDEVIDNYEFVETTEAREKLRQGLRRFVTKKGSCFNPSIN